MKKYVSVEETQIKKNNYFFWLAIAAAAFLILFSACKTIADDTDIDLVPDIVQADTATPAAAADKKKFNVNFFLNNIFQTSRHRGGMWNINDYKLEVNGDVINLQDYSFNIYSKNWAILDARADYEFSKKFSGHITNRLIYFTNNDRDLSRAYFKNDLNELYFTYSPDKSNNLQVGRINFKAGAGIGFNPTDYFKRNSANDLFTEDPVALRDNRLGALMAKVGLSDNKNSVVLIYTPKIDDKKNK